MLPLCQTLEKSGTRQVTRGNWLLDHVGFPNVLRLVMRLHLQMATREQVDAWDECLSVSDYEH